jgi:hypothetical protein
VAAATASLPWVLFSYLLVVLVAYVVTRRYAPPEVPAQLQGEALLAVGLFLAQALERFLEPFSRWAGATTVAEGAGISASKNKLRLARDRAMAAAARAAMDIDSTAASAAATTAAKAQAAYDQFRANAAVSLWSLGCVIGMILAASIHLRLLAAVGATVPASLDVVISGIAIGSATKPLHDLIEALKESKKKNDAAAAGDTGS